MSDSSPGFEQPSFSELRRRIGSALQVDRFRLRRQLDGLERAAKSGQEFDRNLKRLTDSLSQSVAAREKRVAGLPKLNFNEELPIAARRDEISAAIKQHQVVILCGETGSGKSTQLPLICLSIGRGIDGFIGHTQPRRIAARSVSTRIAEELGSSVGKAVGFKVRFTDQTGPQTYIKLMTDGILLAESQNDRFFDAYDTIIIDEAHERSLNIDFLLGRLKQLLPRRPELKVIITSATIDAARFAEHFGTAGRPAPVIEVKGRTYPVEVRYRPLIDDVEEEAEDGDEPLTAPAQQRQRQRQQQNQQQQRRRGEPDIQRAILDAVEELNSLDPGDILLFMPTERDIHETAKSLRGRLLPQNNKGRATEILPLYARLSDKDQQRIFESHSQRRIVIATNVAESSLTVPGIRYVIDTGTARISRYSARSRMQRLPVEPVSQASASQRAGRCGRLGPGVCIRLYSQEDLNAREPFTPPEIQRTDLASVILQTKALQLGPIEDFPFLEPPKTGTINDGYRTLFELGALDEKNELTEIGRKLSRMPVDPRVGRIILASHDENCLSEMLIIAAGLEQQDPRDRPIDQQQAADEAHQQFKHPDSDFLSYLKLWDFYHHLTSDLSRGKLRKACQQNFLSYNRLREWVDIHQQLCSLIQEAGLRPGKRRDDPDSIHRALLTGFVGNIAMGGDTPEYTAAGNQKVLLWPGSGLVGKKVKWLVAGELIETTRRYVRCNARINPEWIEPLAGHLIKRTYSDPEWDAALGCTMAFERVTLFGLPLVARRRVNYSKIDEAKCRQLMIQHGLVEGVFEFDFEFAQHNKALLEELEGLQTRTRRSDLIVDDEVRFDFYDKRLPADVCDVHRLRRWLKSSAVAGASRPRQGAAPARDAEAATRDAEAATREGEAPAEPRTSLDLDRRSGSAGASPSRSAASPSRLEQAPRAEARRLSHEQAKTLHMTKADLRRVEALDVTGQEFPDRIKVQHMDLAIEYHLDPGAPQDGITLTVPKEALNQLDQRRLGWLVPGLVEEKVTALIKSMPKEKRRMFVPATESAKAVLVKLKFGDGDFEDAVAKALSEVGRERVQRQDFDLDRLPNHLRMNVRVLNAEGKSIADGRDLQEIRKKLGSAATASFSQISSREWNRDNITDWTFGDLPAQVSIQRGDVELKGYPSLLDRGTSVSMRLIDLPTKAAIETRAGLRRLALMALKKHVKYQIDNLPSLSQWSLMSAAMGCSATFQEDLGGLMIDRAFFPEKAAYPRTEAEYRTRLNEARGNLSVAVQDIVAVLTPLFARYGEARAAVNLAKAPSWFYAVKDAKAQLAELTGPGFLTRCAFGWLRQYPRYFEAIDSRLKKLGTGGAARDQKSHEIVQSCVERHRQRAAEHATRDLYDTELDLYRWLIEELRVSLFAQELRTAMPISEVRLEKQWEKVRE